MHVLITAVGQRTEHWIGLLTTLLDQSDVELTLYAADVSPLTVEALTDLDRERDRFHFLHVPHLLSERRTGHMASVVFRPDALRRLKTIRPDIVHVIGEASYLSTFQTIRAHHRYWPTIPITLYAAQNTLMRLPSPFPSLERYAYRCVTHTFPITPAALALLRAKGYQGPASIVPLGVDIDTFQPRAVPPHPFTIGFVGRLEPHKGIRDLLRVAELLDCDVLVVGNGSLRGEVERAAQSRPGRVHLEPWLSHNELPATLARMDALLLPAVEILQRNVVPWIGIPLREQFGRVLIEAMACGIPVVGSEVGEVPHVIGPAGLTFPAADVPAMVDRVTRLRDDPAFAQRLGEIGRQRAETEFSWTRIAEALLRTWQDLAETARQLNAVTSPLRASDHKDPGRLSTVHSTGKKRSA